HPRRRRRRAPTDPLPPPARRSRRDHGRVRGVGGSRPRGGVLPSQCGDCGEKDGVRAVSVRGDYGLFRTVEKKSEPKRAIGKGRAQLLMPLAGGAALATLVQAATGFANSQVVSIAAQRAITEMRKRVQDHVVRLPVSYFDSTKTGVLISRVMSDAEGVRNIVGTGLIQLVGSVITAVLALGILFWLNWKLTAVMIIVLGSFAGMMAIAFKRLR